ncbi:MAG: PAS domain S-box protein [Vicinamibacterales bacterium]
MILVPNLLVEKRDRHTVVLALVSVAAALAIALSALSASYFFLAPYYAFSLTSKGAYVLVIFTLASSALVMLIARLKANERKWRGSDDLFGKAFRANPSALAITRASDHRLIEINPAFCALVGCSREESIGRTATELGLVSAEQREKNVAEIREKGRLPERLFVFTNRAGATRQTLLTAEPVDYQGQPHFIAVLNDITERKHAEDALHEQATLLANAQRIGRMGSWSLNLRTRRLAWPDATCELFGIAPAEFDGAFDQFHSFILPEDVPVYDAANARASASEPLFEAEYRIRRPDGVVRWMHSRGEVDLDAAGNPIGQTGMVMDITEQRLEREQFIENAALLRTAGRVAHLGGWTLQLPARTLTWSDENCVIHDVPPGYQPTLEEGLALYLPENRAEVIRHLEACERDGTPYDFELPKLTATGRRIWVRSIGEAVRGAEGTITRLHGAFQDVTDRRHADESLRNSEAQFRTLAEAMPQMVWMTRPDGWNIYFNQRWVDYTGLSLEDSSGHGWNTPFHPDDRQRAWDAWQQAIADGGYNVECRLRGADGGYRWMLVRGLPFRDEAGQITKWIGTCTDVDDLKRAQEANSMQAHMLDQIGRAVIATDAGGRVTYANRFAGELYGWGPGEMLGLSITQVTVPQASRQQGQEIMARLQAGETWTGEFLVQTRQGRVFPVQITDSPVLDGQGHLIGIVGISSDISARKRAEEDIRQKDVLIRIAGRITRTGGWTIEMPDERVSWSDEVFDLLEFPRGSVPPLAEALALYLEPGREKLGGAIQACTRDGTPFDMEVEILTHKGTRKWVRVSGEAAPRADGTITLLQGAFQDITERKQLERQYLRAQRMESIGTLAGGIAHDLNNVLAPILLSIGLLQEDEHDPGRLQTLATIETSAKRGAAMVSRVLSFARGMDGQRIEVRMMPLILDLGTIVHDTFPKNIVFESHFGLDLWTLQADPTQLHQVLLNLCVNARDAMPAGGRITITAKNVVIDEPFAAMNIDARTGPYVMIEVEDTGTGISPEIIDRIFDPFFTTKDIGKGTGLGLATSLAIVKGHEGFVRAYSHPGIVTRFRIYLPARSGLATPLPAVGAEIRPRGNGETVLVVDDEAAIRQIAERTLKAFGYRVLLAGDGAEAVALYAEHQADVAVVLTDMMMPVMNGSAMILELVRLNPGVRIICASGLASDANVAAECATHFLAKPYTAETLLTAIKGALP